MDVHSINAVLLDLKADRGRINAAIAALEHIAAAKLAKRRGRPPKWMADARKNETVGTEPRRRGRPRKKIVPA